MKKSIQVLMLAACLCALLAPAAQAAVDVQRQGSENSMVEVARSTFYGALAGTVVGSAIALVAEGDGEPVKWGFVLGTFAGLGYGLYQVNQRPAVSLLELHGGVFGSGGLAAVEAAPGGMRVHAIGLRF